MSPEPENVLFVFCVTLRFILSLLASRLFFFIDFGWPFVAATADKSHRCPLLICRTLVLIYVAGLFDSGLSLVVVRGSV